VLQAPLDHQEHLDQKDVEWVSVSSVSAFLGITMLVLGQGNIGFPGAKGEAGPQGRPGPEVRSMSSFVF
jgi:hypothetical protein